MTDKIIKIDPSFKGTAGTSGFVSWQRMETILRDAGQLRKGETVEGYCIEDAGVNFFIKRD